VDYDDQTMLRASPVYIRIAAIAGCLLSAPSAAIAAYVYGVLPHPSIVHHLSRSGAAITESIDSYLFALPSSRSSLPSS